MNGPRLDHVSVVVEDLSAATAFFVALGLELEGEQVVEGPTVDAIVGIDGLRTRIAMLRTPDGSGRLELTTYERPTAIAPEPHPAPPNALGYRTVMFEVDDLDAMVERLRLLGGALVREVAQYEDSFRLCYLRGPEGLLVALAQSLR